MITFDILSFYYKTCSWIKMKRVIVEEICLLLWPGVHFVSGNFLCNTWIARHIWRHLHQLLSYMSLSWRGITVFTPSQCSKMLTLAVMWAVLTARSLSLWGFGELIKVVTQTCGCRGNRQHVTLCFWHMLRSIICFPQTNLTIFNTENTFKNNFAPFYFHRCGIKSKILYQVFALK